MSGWIKLQRDIVHSAIWANSDLLKVWLHCLFKSAHKPQHFNINTGNGVKLVSIVENQLIWGRMTDGASLQMSPSTADRHIKKLHEMKVLHRKTFKHYTIITLLVSVDYQQVMSPSEQAMNKPWTSHEQAMNTYKKDKKEEKDKNNNIEAFSIAPWGQIKAAFQTLSKTHIPESDNKHFTQIVYDLRESIKAARKAKGEMPTVCDDDIVKAAKYIIANYPEWAKKEPSYFRYNFSNITSHIREAQKSAPKGNGKGKKL